MQPKSSSKGIHCSCTRCDLAHVCLEKGASRVCFKTHQNIATYSIITIIPSSSIREEETLTFLTMLWKSCQLSLINAI